MLETSMDLSLAPLKKQEAQLDVDISKEKLGQLQTEESRQLKEEIRDLAIKYPDAGITEDMISNGQFEEAVKAVSGSPTFQRADKMVEDMGEISLYMEGANLFRKAGKESVGLIKKSLKKRADNLAEKKFYKLNPEADPTGNSLKEVYQLDEKDWFPENTILNSFGTKEALPEIKKAIRMDAKDIFNEKINATNLKEKYDYLKMRRGQAQDLVNEDYLLNKTPNPYEKSLSLFSDKDILRETYAPESLVTGINDPKSFGDGFIGPFNKKYKGSGDINTNARNAMINAKKERSDWLTVDPENKLINPFDTGEGSKYYGWHPSHLEDIQQQFNLDLHKRAMYQKMAKEYYSQKDLSNLPAHFNTQFVSPEFLANKQKHGGRIPKSSDWEVVEY